MINFLHSFRPSALLLDAGPINIHWYGLCLVLGIIAALLVSFYLGRYYNISRDDIFDLSFWLIIGGLLGARIYDVLLELPYYIGHPQYILAVWRGGLAIHGGIIAGIIIIWLFARRRKISFFKLSALILPGLAIGQAIGRWGNYFNQELFGRPTNLPWGIPIDILNRPADYVSFSYFHPTFLYESLGCLIIFLILLFLNLWAAKRQKFSQIFYVWLLSLYMVLYSILRFSLETIKIDATPHILGLRWPQFMSLIIMALAFALSLSYHARPTNKL